MVEFLDFAMVSDHDFYPVVRVPRPLIGHDGRRLTSRVSHRRRCIEIPAAMDTAAEAEEIAAATRLARETYTPPASCEPKAGPWQ